MSYAIIRNRKLTRQKSIGAYIHDERKAKNHSNKNIDNSKTQENYYLKQNELSYIKEFDRLKQETNLQGQIRTNSNILCEMIFTSDGQFFDGIGYEETRRYFRESYNFVCNYKNLGEQNIISAVVHLDEDTPHMHLLFAPVIHTKDKEGNAINKLSCRDFWKGQNSYRDLQNKFYEYISSKGFNLERGKVVEETDRKHYEIAEYKQLTNFENGKKLLESITLDLPPVPELKRTDLLNPDKAIKKAIEPRDKLIQELHQDKVSLHKELSKQVKLVELASKFDDERDTLLAEKRELKTKCEDLTENFNFEKRSLEHKYESKIRKLEKQVKYLENMIDKFKVTIKKFIQWVVKKFSAPSEDDFMRSFERETYANLNVDKQLDYSQFEKQEKSRGLEL